MEPGLEDRVAASGELLQRAQSVVAHLQVGRAAGGRACRTSPACPQLVPPLPPLLQTDVGGLLYELDARLGTSFHQAVVAELPAIHAAAAAAPSASSSGSSGGTGRHLLQAAQQRTALLQRAYETITGLQQDVDACLAELGNGGAAGCATSPLPFPLLGTPGGMGHAGSALPSPGPAAARQVPPPLPQQQQQQQQGLQEQLPQCQQEQAQQLFRPQGQQQGQGQASDLHPPAEQPASPREDSGGRGSSVGSGAGGAMPPAQPAARPAVLSPSTAAFIGAAFSARETEAAEHAAQPRAVLNTSLKDATVETGR